MTSQTQSQISSYLRKKYGTSTVSQAYARAKKIDGISSKSQLRSMAAAALAQQGKISEERAAKEIERQAKIKSQADRKFTEQSLELEAGKDVAVGTKAYVDANTRSFIQNKGQSNINVKLQSQQQPIPVINNNQQVKKDNFNQPVLLDDKGNVIPPFIASGAAPLTSAEAGETVYAIRTTTKETKKVPNEFGGDVVSKSNLTPKQVFSIAESSDKPVERLFGAIGSRGADIVETVAQSAIATKNALFITDCATGGVLNDLVTSDKQVTEKRTIAEEALARPDYAGVVIAENIALLGLPLASGDATGLNNIITIERSTGKGAVVQTGVKDTKLILETDIFTFKGGNVPAVDRGDLFFKGKGVVGTTEGKLGIIGDVNAESKIIFSNDKKVFFNSKIGKADDVSLEFVSSSNIVESENKLKGLVSEQNILNTNLFDVPKKELVSGTRGFNVVEQPFPFVKGVPNDESFFLAAVGDVKKDSKLLTSSLVDSSQNKNINKLVVIEGEDVFVIDKISKPSKKPSFADKELESEQILKTININEKKVITDTVNKDGFVVAVNKETKRTPILDFFSIVPSAQAEEVKIIPKEETVDVVNVTETFASERKVSPDVVSVVPPAEDLVVDSVVDTVNVTSPISSTEQQVSPISSTEQQVSPIVGVDNVVSSTTTQVSIFKPSFTAKTFSSSSFDVVDASTSKLTPIPFSPKTISKKEDKKKKDDEDLFEAIARIRGSFEVVGFGRSKAEAAFKGLSFARSTPSASVGVRKKGSSKLLNFKTPKDFYSKKTSKGKIAIEKNVNRINTGGELKGITFKGITASKRRRRL